MSYDDRDDMPQFEVERSCSSCGARWTGSSMDSGACSCGTMASESYSSADAERWNRSVDRRARGDW